MKSCTTNGIYWTNLNNIPKACFLIGQFLNQIEEHKNDEGAYSTVYRNFLSTIHQDRFPFITSGTILMMCYGLLVFPKEWHDKSNLKIDYEQLEEMIISVAKEHKKPISKASCLFTKYPAETKTTEDILRNLRHAVAHASIEVEYQQADTIYRFKGENSRNQGEFEINNDGLSILLTAAGRYFSEHPRKCELKIS